MESRSTTYLEVKDWERFQHYKDRSPPWIKLYNELLDDYEFACLQDASKMHLIGIWLLASRLNNRVPADRGWLAKKINATEPIDLPVLLSTGFLKPCGDASGALADCVQDAIPRAQRGEGEGETEVERETEKEAAPRAREAEPDHGSGSLEAIGVRPDIARAFRNHPKVTPLIERGLVGQYGPSGTLAHYFKGIPEDRRADLLSTAIIRAVTEKTDGWHGAFFAKVLAGVCEAERRNGDGPVTAAEEESRHQQRRADAEARKRRSEQEKAKAERDRERKAADWLKAQPDEVGEDFEREAREYFQNLPPKALNEQMIRGYVLERAKESMT